MPLFIRNQFDVAFRKLRSTQKPSPKRRGGGHRSPKAMIQSKFIHNFSSLMLLNIKWKTTRYRTIETMLAASMVKETIFAILDPAVEKAYEEVLAKKL